MDTAKIWFILILRNKKHQTHTRIPRPQTKQHASNYQNTSKYTVKINISQVAKLLWVKTKERKNKRVRGFSIKPVV